MSNLIIPSDSGSDMDIEDLLTRAAFAQSHKMYSDFSAAFGILELSKIKESKAYRKLKGKKFRSSANFSGTWEDFCNLLGLSVDKVDKDIANLRTFGEAAIDSMQRLGIGYRQFDEYRRLPEDDRQAIIEAAQAGDKSAFVEVAEALIEKHAREKEAFEGERRKFEFDLQEEQKRVARISDELQEEQDKVADLRRARAENPDFSVETNTIRYQSALLEEHCAAALGELGAMAEVLFEEWQELGQKEGLARLHSLYFSTISTLSRASLLLSSLREFGGEELPPEMPVGIRLLPDEASQHLANTEAIRHALSRKLTAEKERVESDAPRKRGRPKGSKSREQTL